MKLKVVKIFGGIALVSSLLSPSAAFAHEFQKGTNPLIKINGNFLTTAKIHMENDKVYVDIDTYAKTIGTSYTYDKVGQTITINNKTIPAHVMDGTVFAHIRALGAATGKEVAWISAKNAVEVTDSTAIKATNTAATNPKEVVATFAELQQVISEKELNYDKVGQIYKTKLQSMVQELDANLSEHIDETLTQALKDGKEGKLEAGAVAELFEKLLYKELFASVRYEFKEVGTYFTTDKDKAKAAFLRATEFYAGLKPTITKADEKFKTAFVPQIDGAFTDMNSALEKGDSLHFQLSKQAADKAIMKAFYLKTDGYAYKVEKLAKEDSPTVKAEQAEAWALYQSLYGYLKGSAKEDADFINQQFALTTDPKKISADAIHAALVRGFVEVAKDEYAGAFSEKSWGQDKAKIVTLEGNLFVNMVEGEVKKQLGEAEYARLTDLEQKLLEAVKKDEKATAEELYKQVVSLLDTAAAKMK
ncbi:hypothetical protein DFP93_12135 [Aneurinibacillus soli]|uniref:Uncharacterized protein n=1 Tax=Aneurinibacillus soli TaxID=1500254 RepID=A0A0U4WCX0_9BACL|nr:hypothetical protein [Aneurinibacillus soli]PYE58784.1 hypothetical protein DFP93_12135 [Aneurinibacillus soli]BAU26649.1 hypothetical protein CB4_00791 [Aneurinibacillus soli]